MASNCSYGLVSSFLLLYLSDVLGMDTGIVGTLMLVSKIFDGVTDVFFGTMIDKTRSKLGKARPWMLYAQIGVSVCLILLFSIPNMGQTAQYAYFFAFYTCLNAIFYTANGVAYSTLSALITSNAQERVQLGSIRFMFAVVTNIVMGFAVTNTVNSFGGGARGWRAVAIICALIGLVVNTISCLAMKEVEPEQTDVKAQDGKPEDDRLSFFDSIKLLFANKYYIIIVTLYIVYYIMSNITTGSGVFFARRKDRRRDRDSGSRMAPCPGRICGNRRDADTGRDQHDLCHVRDHPCSLRRDHHDPARYAECGKSKSEVG